MAEKKLLFAVLFLALFYMTVPASDADEQEFFVYDDSMEKGDPEDIWLTYDMEPGEKEDAPSGIRKQICDFAMTYMGTPYISGGKTPKPGFDCSGLIQYVFHKKGINLEAYSRRQFEQGAVKSVRDMEPGDVVFFQVYSAGRFGEGKALNKITKHIKTNPTHVGIYLGNGIFIHAPSKGQVVKKSDLRKPFWASHIIGVRDYTAPRSAWNAPKTRVRVEAASKAAENGKAKALKAAKKAKSAFKAAVKELVSE